MPLFLGEFDDAVERGEQIVRQGLCQFPVVGLPYQQSLLLKHVIDVAERDESCLLLPIVEHFNPDFNDNFFRLKLVLCTLDGLKARAGCREVWIKSVDPVS